MFPIKKVKALLIPVLLAFPLSFLSGETVRIVFAGDIMVHQTFLDAFKEENGYDFNFLFSEIKSEINGDINICNLETTLAGPERGYCGYPNFRSPDAILDAVKKCGFTHINLCNNHSLDSGMKGLIRTKQKVLETGLVPIGTYIGFYEERFVIEDVKNMRFVFLSYTFGTNGIVPEKRFEYCISYLGREKMLDDIAAAGRYHPDFIFVLLHFGEEYVSEPSGDQIGLARFLLENGVDFVIGMHPHVVQPFDRYNADTGKIAFFSLGNFASSQTVKGSEIGLLASFEFDSEEGVCTSRAVDTYLTVRQKVKKNGRIMYRIINADKNNDRIPERSKIYYEAVRQNLSKDVF